MVECGGLEKMLDKNKIVLLLGVMLFLLVNIITLKNGHNWGDDFSQYLTHAKNIVEGRPYSQGLILNAWEVPGPGFPLLLAPFLKLFGINFRIFKFCNVIYWLVSSYFFYLIAKKRLKSDHAVLFFFFLLSSPFFFTFKQSVISDIPFLAFLAPAIFLWIKYFELESAPAGQRRRTLLWAIGLTAMAYLVRYGPGLVLFLSLICYVMFVKRKIFLALILCGSLSVIFFIDRMLGVTVINHAQEIPASFFLCLKNLLPMLVFSLLNMLSILTPFTQMPYALAYVSAFIVLVATVIIFLVRVMRGKTDFDEWFFIFYFFGVNLWYMPDGARYLFPISPLAAVFFIESSYKISKKVFLPVFVMPAFLKCDLIGLCLIILCLLNSICIARNYSFDDDQIYRSETTQLVQNMKLIIKKDEVFTAVRARTLSFLTDRQGVKLHWPFDVLVRYYNVGYFVKLKSQWNSAEHWDPESTELVYAPIFNFVPVWQNDRFVIYKVLYKR